jgi:dTDP-4-dehydrorhamnose 3,5-epimerase-like enzyme
MSDFQVLALHAVNDVRGTLTILQDSLPFEVLRTFWINGADGQTRGGHRHHVTRQALVAVSGSVSVYMDDGRHQATVNLGAPSQCLIVEPEDWHTMLFGPGAVLLVFASHDYDPADYIPEPYLYGSL